MTQAPPAKKRTRVGDVIVVLLIVGVIVGAAFYQEQIQYFFKLRMWDQAAPAQAVSGLVAAVQARDQQKASGFLGGTEIKPLTRAGKWAGYHIDGLGFKNDMEFADLVPSGAAETSKPEFTFAEGGGAQLRIKNSRAQRVLYALKMQDGGWKVVTIRVGQ
jgi:hypothetical protein